MPYVPQQDLERFDQDLRKSFQRLGGGKLGLDSNSVRAAVRSNKDAAYRYVEIHCHMAAGQPGYLQPAIIVATAYQVEFDDETLVDMVMKRANDLNAMAHLEAVGYAPSLADLQKEPPEREAARQWWKSSSIKEGMCDSCRTPLRRGDGYLLNGRLVMLGELKINLGTELLCRECFEKYRSAPRDPGGEGDDYHRIS
jgi:CRISPR/Cas system-associated protein Cas10 (large subunit of type III CRISPR-Cas system)